MIFNTKVCLEHINDLGFASVHFIFEITSQKVVRCNQIWRSKYHFIWKEVPNTLQNRPRSESTVAEQINFVEYAQPSL